MKTSSKNIRKIGLATALLCCLALPARPQNPVVKTNGLYWAALAPNAGVEFKTGRKTSLELFGAYRPWTLGKTDARFWLAQPEGRYWLCEPFEGHFFGIHLLGGQYYAFSRNRIYDGYMAGGGFTYGYDWILAPHWNLEALVGIGYARLWYKMRPNRPCAKCFSRETGNYIGPTKIAVTISYLF